LRMGGLSRANRHAVRVVGDAGTAGAAMRAVNFGAAARGRRIALHRVAPAAAQEQLLLGGPRTPSRSVTFMRDRGPRLTTACTNGRRRRPPSRSRAQSSDRSGACRTGSVADKHARISCRIIKHPSFTPWPSSDIATRRYLHAEKGAFGDFRARADIGSTPFRRRGLPARRRREISAAELQR